MYPSKTSTSSFSGCGITGAIEFSPNALSKVNTEAMLRSLAHRGPNASNFFSNRPIWLGHRRLSILDLSDRGNQPMTRDHLTIISNGEIYNFKEIRQKLVSKGYSFTSETDTEVILRAFQEWGTESIHQLNGMFAFAIWDNHKKELLLVRDRMGVKPLYFSKVKDIFLFASEVQSLLHSSIVTPTINFEELELETLGSSFIKYNNEDTLIQNIKSLLPGHYMRISTNGKIQILKYWDLPENKDSGSIVNPNMLVQELDELLNSSIKYRLVSDVPVSCFLSGGLDSSIISALAANSLTEGSLTNITITYKDGGRDRYTMQEDQDLYFSKILSHHLGNKSVHKVIETETSEITIEKIDKIIDMAHLTDDSRLLSIYNNYELVKDLGYKVVLNGQGADELMGGYAGLPVFYNSLLLAENENSLAENMMKLSALSNSSLFNSRITDRKHQLKGIILDFILNSKSPIDEKIHRYLMKSSLQRILKFEDHISMLNSVECRLPFLDYRLVEWTFSKPFAIHIDSNLKQGKSLLRKVAGNYLPSQLSERPKQTFPAIDPLIGKKKLENIVTESFEEIFKNSTICSLYKVNEPKVSAFTFNELWQLIITWRWSEKLNSGGFKG